MQHSGVLPISSDPLPPRFLSRLAGFADLFTRPTWSNVLVLLAGVILAPGRCTVTTALRILGRDRDPDFCTFHRILNRAAWSSRAAAGRLLLLLVTAFVPSGAPVVIGIDDTIERRWGPKISARGIYRDPVRSAAGADPLAARSRSQRRTRTAGHPGYRSQRPSVRYPRLVRQSLAGRSHLRGNPRPSRRRNSAPVVRQGNSSHHSGAARSVLHRHPLGARSLQVTKAQASNRRLVSKSIPDLQRCNRGGTSRNMGPSDFFHVPAKPRQCRNSQPYLAPNGKCPRPRRLNRPKSSSEF